MTTPPFRKFSLLFAMWDYLNQPVFDSDVKFVFNPVKFTVGYRTSLLERCWTRDYTLEKKRNQLEQCWENNDTQNDNHGEPRLSDPAASERD